MKITPSRQIKKTITITFEIDDLKTLIRAAVDAPDDACVTIDSYDGAVVSWTFTSTDA